MNSLLGVLLLAASPPPVTLKRVPVVDSRASYSMKAVIDLGGKDDIRFTGNFNEKVKSVDSESFVTAVESRVSVDVMGVVRQSAMVASERTEKLDGSLVTAAKVDSTLLFGTARVDRLRAFYFPKTPVEIGASWWRTEAKNDELKAPPFSSYVKLEGEEKIGNRDTWRATIDAHEVDDANPTHVRGMVWLDKTDGSLVRGQWAVDGYSYSLTAPTITARYELARSD